jgi:C-terminal processing protease CtpA/Prc
VLVVLIDENTSGAAEALAATLRWNAKALLVGARSSGRCVEFTVKPLGAGNNLRLATAEVRVAGQPIYPRGLRPDIEISQDPEVRATILSEALEKGMATFVFEPERSQLNEAALVAGTNPEIDAEISSGGLIDRPLQRAVDLVTAVRLFRKPE